MFANRVFILFLFFIFDEQMNSINKHILIEAPLEWEDYEIIDSGDGYKLERFGEYYLARPEPKAMWSKSLSDKEWDKLAHVFFKPGAGFGKAGKEESGSWERLKKMSDNWFIEYKGKDYKAQEWSLKRHGHGEEDSYRDKLYFKLKLGLTAFKHIGVFPEQAPNWEWIYSKTKEIKNRIDTAPKILNLFAYTGAATLAAKCSGGDVTHVDSVKQVVNWGKENMTNSGLDNIRWIIDDALKFVKREIRRGNSYNGIILDPPAYGHGPDGERWKLDELIFEMLSECEKIVAKKDAFVVLNLYSNGYSALLAETLLKKALGFNSNAKETKEVYTSGELVLKDKFDKVIPLSVFTRLER